MSAIADITVNDGAATPVAQTFNPTRNEPGLATYHNRVDGVAAGYPELTIGNRMPSNGNRNYKATVKIRLPVLETASTAASGFTPGPTVAYSLMGKVDIVIPDRATAAERADLLALLANALDHSTVVSLVEDIEPPY